MARMSGSWQRHITERPANGCSILKQISTYSKEEKTKEKHHKMDLLVHVTFSSAQISLPRANSTTVSDDHRQNDQNHDISYGIYSQHVCLFFKSDRETTTFL